MTSTEPKFPIKVVAKRTGLSTHVIRIWERRYGAVAPGRTKTNRRMYSESDIERLALLRQLTSGGLSIGTVANLPEEQLQQLARRSPGLVTIQHVLAPSVGSQNPRNTPAFHVRACLDAVETYNPEALDIALETADLAFPRALLLEQVLSPLLIEVGKLWEEGCIRVAQEHLATGVIRTFLGRIHAAMLNPPDGPVFLSSTPEGQSHELGALMATIAAKIDGWNTMFLGPSLPAEDIAAVAVERSACAVGLSIVYVSDYQHVVRQLQLLRRYLPKETALVAGGGAAMQFQDTLDELGAFRVASLRELRNVLSALRGSGQFAVATRQ